MRGTVCLVVIGLLPAPAAAQSMLQELTRPNTVLVSATGKVETAPDMATMRLTVRGEGKTPDAATTALATRQKAVVAGLRGLDPKLEVRTGDISISEVRSGHCGGFDGSDSMVTASDVEMAADTMVETMATSDGQTRTASKEPCRVTGHRATIETTIRLASVKDAGTAVGLAGRLGASEAHVEGFALRDDTAAARRALDQAMANARAQATALAAASGSKLGPVVSIMNGDATGGLRANRLVSYDMAMPAVMSPPPIAVEIAPTPVETTAQIVVTFTLIP